MEPGYVEREVLVGDRMLSLVVPDDPETLFTDAAFANDEFVPYWAELWPSGLALADLVGGLEGRRVVELGCGLGVPSLVAALAGADVVATDWSQDAIGLLERNAARVGARLRARLFNWGRDADGLEGDVILAADVLYEARNGPALLAALDAVVAPGGEVWIADPGRPSAPAFFTVAEAAWTIDEIAPRVRRLRRR